MNAPEPRQMTAPGGRRPRAPRRALHGVVMLDKPVGLSSNDALQRVKRLFAAEKAGHTGTLDPLASGLLPICLGAATKFSQVSLDADKAYRAWIHLGQTSSTGDAEGERSEQLPLADFDLSQARLQLACASFLGEIEQIPPMHSALKHQGRALYDYAREGIEIERAPRRVHIHAIDMQGCENGVLCIDVRCSKGTYIRTLAQDLGRHLGCGAHLAALRRTASGPLVLEQALSLEALEGMDAATRDTHILPVDTLLRDWPQVQLDEVDASRFLMGMRRRLPGPDQPQVRVYGPRPQLVGGEPTPPALAEASSGVLLGSAHRVGGELIASRLLSPLEVQGLLQAPLTPFVN